MDAQFIVVGKVESENRNTGNIKITWSLIDIFKEKTVISMRYIGKKSQYRAIAHKVSDNVYEHLTGSKGVFHTKIAYVKKVNDKKYSLNVADFDGFNSKPILNTTQPIISPRWSPDGEKIAYVSFEKKKPVIYIQNLRTGKRTLLANFKGNNSAPAWSPDSRKLAIVLTYNKNSQIYMINADGSGIKQLMRSNSINTEPSWTPNGEEIYFSSNRGGSPQIYKVNIENDEITRVTYEGKYNLSPSISYDGKLLLFLTEDQGKFKVAIQNLISNQVLKISEGPSDESPIFAPNGHLVLFAYKDYGKTTKIGTVSINGLKRVPISVGNSIIQEPTWGPINN
jgi:TolB protein